MKKLTDKQREQIEMLHDNGQMPDWAYYQQVPVPWYISIPAQVSKFKEEADARNAKEQEAEQLKKDLQNDADEIARKSFTKIFNEFL